MCHMMLTIAIQLFVKRVHTQLKEAELFEKLLL